MTHDLLKLAGARGVAPSRSVLTDLHPARRVCVEGGGGYLMDADPSPAWPRLTSEGGPEVGMEGVSPASMVVARFYGAERAAQLQQWFAEASGLKC